MKYKEVFVEDITGYLEPPDTDSILINKNGFIEVFIDNENNKYKISKLHQ